MYQLVSAAVFTLTIGSTYPDQTITCDNKDAAIEIVTTHHEEGLALARAVYARLEREDVCRVDRGSHRIEGLKESAVLVDGDELAVVKMSHDGRTYWGIMVDVDIE
jgi:hypothetical protein